MELAKNNIMQSTNDTQLVLQHHLSAFTDNDHEEIMKDYSDESWLCTPDGKLTGMSAIRSFFSNVINLFPAGQTKLDVKQMIVENDKAYLFWNSDSPVASIPFATDSFEIEDGKILWQTVAAQIVMK